MVPKIYIEKLSPKINYLWSSMKVSAKWTFWKNKKALEKGIFSYK